jgi:Fic family protein
MTGAAEDAGYAPFPVFAEWAALRVETEVFNRYAAVLDRLKETTEPARLERAVRTATRLAAIDTGAIEGLYDVDRGFTMTVAVEAAAWEAAIEAREPVVRRSFEDALRAYDFVLDLATTRTEISAKAIREIHATICASQEKYRVLTSVGWQEHPLPAGEYKSLPNNPTRTSTGRRHFYAPPSDTPAEMDRLVRQLRSPEFLDAHPILQASYAHYAFVRIHPFADGNGRVARALASVYLYRRPGVPLVIFADQKDEYIDTLEAADAGDGQPLARFVEDRVADIIGIIEVATARPDVPPATASLASLRELYAGEPGLSRDDVNAIAARIVDAAAEELHQQLAAGGLPALVHVSVDRMGLGPYDWRSFRDAVRQLPGAYEFAGPYSAVATLQVLSGVAAQVRLAPAILSTGQNVPLFALVTTSGQALAVHLREVHPVLSGVFLAKLKAWVDAVASELLARFDQAAREDQRQRQAETTASRQSPGDGS